MAGVAERDKHIFSPTGYNNARQFSKLPGIVYFIFKEEILPFSGGDGRSNGRVRPPGTSAVAAVPAAPEQAAEEEHHDQHCQRRQD